MHPRDSHNLFVSPYSRHKIEDYHQERGKSRRGESMLSGPVLRIGVAVATAVALLLLRFKVMGSTLPVFTNFDNPASYEEAPAKQVRMGLDMEYTESPALKAYLDFSKQFGGTVLCLSLLIKLLSYTLS